VVVVGVVVVGVVVVRLVVVVVVVVLVVVVGVEAVLAVRQFCWASWPTVEAPWARSSRSVVLTVEGRFATAWSRPWLALEAASQRPAATAEETWLSWLERLFAWSAESRPAPPPQAARHETANPRLPARATRGQRRIRDLTLEGALAALRLESP
jgi:hypothetical protein